MPVDISNLGEGLLTAVLLLCGIAAILALAASKLDVGAAGKALFYARSTQLVATVFLIAAMILLIAAFLTDDFSIAVVGQFSSVEQPFFYKLSAVWAGSAGSLLLWSVGVFVLFGLWLLKSKIDDPAFNAAALFIGAGVCIGFSALLLFVARPFASSPAAIDNGAGLNPLLQNFWMIIHPPLLFVGYSAFLIPFVIVTAAVLADRVTDFYIYAQPRRWLLFGICFLSMGIATGARWSYLEQGWGGYWSWDPVENASLLPWLVAIAALHSAVGIWFADEFRYWSVVLLPLPFIMCLVATFITRSGILQSVHAFSHNITFSALLVFMACCFLLWIVCLIRVLRNIVTATSSSKINAFHLTGSGLIFWANVVFICTAIVIAAATFWPVIWRVITGLDSGPTLTRVFYDRVISMIGVILAFLVGLAGLVGLRRRGSGLVTTVLGCCAAGLICFGLALRFGGRPLLMRLACAACAFSFVAVVTKLLSDLKAKGRIGGDIAHLGLLFLVIAAAFSSREKAGQVQLAKGEKFVFNEYEFVYDEFVHKLSDGATKVGPEIVVRKEAKMWKLWPHNNLYPGGKSTSEVAVRTGLLEDIYVSFDGIARGGGVIITAKVKFLMFWLWFAALLIIAGLALAVFEGKRK